MTLEEVIKYFSSNTALAFYLNIDKSAISRWHIANRVPYVQQLKIEQITNGALKADNKRDLRIHKSNEEIEAEMLFHKERMQSIVNVYKHIEELTLLSARKFKNYLKTVKF